MENELYFETSSTLLVSVLRKLMESQEFDAFRLVGGTALSLQRGHRLSIDIDLFTDAPYDSIDFNSLENFLRANWLYVDTNNILPIGMGKSFFVGLNRNDCIKLDLYYTDDFITDIQHIDGIRLASMDDIIAMKVDVIGRGGRKKDFWDIHELSDNYTLDQMLEMHKKRYPYSHDRENLLVNFTHFASADNDFEPICLRQKHWEIIKLDLIDFVKSATSNQESSNK